MKSIKRINFRTAVLMAISFYSLTILIHLLIIIETIPFVWVNGGRSPTLEAQLPLSFGSIVISLIGAIFIIIVGLRKNHTFNKGISIVCWFLVFFWIFGLIQQFFGTPFEKMVCSFVLLLGVLSHYRIAIENR
ncbi:hypothetical protein [Bacillus suaedae]|uniref:Uncharacterized protein n=1 Tax=Halalkalibacter suaedae TaxID=2822140 RepID=A0A940WWE6_9BACI|nr:hypothetical protein [Bacillus suaedae]MBP3951742.1 hypothetical protein [Bacillus suaedae]